MAPSTGDARGRTWAHGMPAMRMQRMRWRLSGQPALSAVARADDAADDAPSASAGFPSSIRLIRALAAVILLALAWVGALAIYLLTMRILAPLTRQRLFMTLPLRVAEGLGTCLLVVVVVTLLIVGAFALSLAVHPNNPRLAPRRLSATGEDE